VIHSIISPVWPDKILSLESALRSPVPQAPGFFHGDQEYVIAGSG
jgi:hypothetical protein